MTYYFSLPGVLSVISLSTVLRELEGLAHEQDPAGSLPYHSDSAVQVLTDPEIYRSCLSTLGTVCTATAACVVFVWYSSNL